MSVCRECDGAKIVVVDYDEAECCELTEECPACNGTGEGEYYNDDEDEHRASTGCLLEPEEHRHQSCRFLAAQAPRAANHSGAPNSSTPSESEAK